MKSNPKRELDQVLDHIVQTLVREYQPDKIILFGSMATGEIHEWSDLDIAIVKDTPAPFFQRLKEVALLCHSPVGTDYLVYTPAEYAQMIAEGNLFILDEVNRKGRVLYERERIAGVAG